MTICKRLIGLATILAAILLSNSGYAHHGRDFLLVQTAHLPEVADSYLISRQDFIAEDHDEIEFEPALLFGVTDWAAFELHSHIEKEDGESVNYESTAPALHLRFTPRANALSLGASFEYEVADDSGDHDVLEFSAIVGFEQQDWHFAANLLAEDERGGDDTQWGYALGGRYALNDQSSMGLEIFGSFENEGSTEVLAGYYVDLSKRFSLLVGVGRGIDNGPDWAFRSGLIFQLGD